MKHILEGLHPLVFSTLYSGTIFLMVSRKRQNNQKHWKTPFETLEVGLASFWTNRKPPRPTLSRGRAARPQKQNECLFSCLLGSNRCSSSFASVPSGDRAWNQSLVSCSPLFLSPGYFSFVYFTQGSLQLLIPNSWCTPPHSLSPLVTINSFPMSVSLFLFCK